MYADHDTGDKPDITERYDSAVHASRLLLEEHRTGAADVLVAAGWSLNRTGMALLRLHSEWQGAAKPRRADEHQLRALAARLAADDAKAKASAEKRCVAWTNPGRTEPRARAEAAKWYANELRILALSLKSRPAVWLQLLPWAVAKGIPEQQVAQALFHWLDPICSHCDGHGLHKAKDAPALSSKQCRACNGTGTKAIPEGGTRVLSHISQCLSEARRGIWKRLRA